MRAPSNTTHPASLRTPRVPWEAAPTTTNSGSRDIGGSELKGSQLKGGKEGEDETVEESLFLETFCSSLAAGGKVKAELRKSILALSAKKWEGASKAKDKAKLRYSPAIGAVLTNETGAEHNAVSSYHRCESGLSALRLQLFATGSSKPTDTRQFTAANCLPLQLLFVQFPGQELGSNCGSGLPIFSGSLVEKPLKRRMHRCSRAFS